MAINTLKLGPICPAPSASRSVHLSLLIREVSLYSRQWLVQRPTTGHRAEDKSWWAAQL